MEQVLGIPFRSIESDIPIVILLTVWNLFVVFILSKKMYTFVLKKGRQHNSSVYFSRKAIHFLAGGLTAVLLPYYFYEPLLPAVLAFGLAMVTYIPHKMNKLMYWFQDPENIYDVDFSLVWGAIVLSTWYIDSTFWLGVIPVLFMAWGDGITGIIRNLLYNKRTKAWEGTAGMLVFCVIIGAKMGIAGMFAGIVCSFVERTEFIDDNISVPAVSLCILMVAYYYAPSFIVPIF